MMLEGHAGNGLHFHFAPVKDGRLLDVRDGEGGLSESSRWLIGGLVQLGAALMAFGNRVEGSFARLVQAKEAPSAIVWGEYDRQALIRLPLAISDARGRAVTAPTVEFRLPDGSANPHLLLAGAALAMIRGRDDPGLTDLLQRTRSQAAGGDDGGAEPVPGSFREVADAVRRQRVALEAGGVFPSGLIDRVLSNLTG